MTHFFVTGTGTDVGKTIISAALANGAKKSGETLCYWKPVQTGADSDTATVAALAPETKTEKSFYHFPLPLSPNQAARTAGKPPIVLADLIRAYKMHGDNHKALLIEGAGGIFVPLNEEGDTWLDFVKASGIPLVVVGTSGLGTLNHTTLTLDALLSRGLPVAAVVLQGPPHPDNLGDLERRFPEIDFHHFPELKGLAVHPKWEEAGVDLWRKVQANLKQTPQSDWLANDRHCWHPYTQHQTAPTPVAITRAKGVWLTTSDGRKLFDATSSWWVNTIGHGRPEIQKAIARQQETLDHCIFAGATHEPATLLASALSKLTGGTFPRVFYTDNGSCAVEVALKIAIQSWTNRGQSGRHLIMGLTGGYHGDTFGAMASAGSETFHSAFRPFLFKSLKVNPVTSHPSGVCPEGAAALPKALSDLEETFATHHQELAAVIVEPMMQGAGGMLVQDQRWLEALRRLTRQHGIPLIFDEVFTGMGRCGAYFTFQRAEAITPDIVCIAKGLTGGTLPLAATLVSEDLFKHFLSTDKRHALLHGHSYTANPIGCAAALATLEIYKRENLISRALEIEETFKGWVIAHSKELKLSAPRVLGAMLAFELPGSGDGSYFSEKSALIPKLAEEAGLFLRPLGNTLYLVPPLSTDDGEIDFLLDATASVIRKFTATS